MELNRIYHGDCLEVMKGIPDGSVDMILCDLPYGTTQNKWDVIIPFPDLWKSYLRVIKENGAIVLTAQQPFATDLISSNKKLFRYDLIWEKSIATGFLNSKKMPLRGHELVLVFYKKTPYYNPQKFMLSTPSFKKATKENGTSSSNYGAYKNDMEKGYKDGSRFPRSVFSIKTEPAFFDSSKKGLMIHPTQKPVALFEYLIRTYTNEGETVLDNCSGSGTTAIACIRNNRNYICIEKNEQYYNDSLKRIENEKYKLF